jgi:hypothetical protein
LPEDDNPYATPFLQNSCDVLFVNLTLTISRQHWFADQPGSSTCVQTSSQKAVYYDSWALNTTQPLGSVNALIELTSLANRMLAGETSNNVWRTDNGTTWTTAGGAPPPPGAIEAMVEATGGAISGNVYAIGNDGGTGAIWSSVDNGVNWAVASAAVGTIVANSITFNTNDNFLYAAISQPGGLIGVNRSSDGTTWTRVFTSEGVGGGILAATDGFVYFIRNPNGLYRSSNGTTWTQVNVDIGATGSGGIFEPGNGFLYVSDDTGLWRSSNGTDWGLISTEQPRGMILATDGRLYACFAATSDTVKVSEDGGFDWKPWSNNLPTGGAGAQLFSIVQYSGNNDIYVGTHSTNSEIWSWAADDRQTLGRAATCNNEVYVANKNNEANLTHIKIDDGGVFTDIFPISSFPQNLYPAVPALNDAIYFGIDNLANESGPFASLVFDIATAAIATTAYAITWEYSDGGAGWPALTTHDNTEASAGDVFGRVGVSSVHWEQPSAWATEAVDGVTAFWVRARISALSGTLTTPTQQNRDVYSIIEPRVEIAAAQVAGDILAIARIRAENQSDEDGRAGSAPDLWSNRIVVGLRDYDRGATFQAYLNAADEQNPAGVTVTLGTNVSFSADSTTPTGRKAVYNPAGVEAMANRVIFGLGSSIARDYYGQFHAFLRVQRTAGAVTDFDVQLQIETGTGGVQSTTDSLQVQSTTAWELLDFGQVRIPASGLLSSTDLGDNTRIIVQASAASGTPNLEIYDLVLIPVDEWAGDFSDSVNSNDSIIGRDDSYPKMLDVDSLTQFKNRLSALIRTADSNEFVVAVYPDVSNGAAALQANARQRLWFLSAQTSATGTSFDWISKPWTAHSLQVCKNQRYFSMRGNR